MPTHNSARRRPAGIWAILLLGLAAIALALVLPLRGHGSWGRRWQILSTIGLAMLAIGLEVAQQGTAHRSFDWVDMIAGLAGVGIIAPAILLVWGGPQPG